MRPLPLAALAVALAACAGAPAQVPGPRVMSGLDVLEAEGFAPLRGKRVGVIANRTAFDAARRPILDLLADAPGVRLTTVFSPEHGFLTGSEAGAAVARAETTVRESTVTVVSLYRGGLDGMRPLAQDLKGLDALVFDIQDVGARFYTYPTTMAMALEAAKASGIELFVLDRPDPVGGTAVEGPLPDEPGLLGTSSVAYLPVATRHGMTVGELALLHNATVGHAKLRVVKMRGWKRSLWYDETGLRWIAPSPNMPDLDAAALYPGVANLEFTNLSVGRGTPTPFGWIGAPWLDAVALARVMNAAGLPGVAFSAETRTPSKDKYAGQAVPGLRMTVTDRKAVRPLRVFARLAAALRDRHHGDFDLAWKDSRKLIGLAAFKAWYDSGEPPEALEKLFDAQAAAFARSRAPYLLYTDE